MEIYTVKPNDNIDQIALTYKVPVDSLIYINQMVYPYALALGQALLIPTANTAKSRVPAETLGYAYPFISPWVLSESPTSRPCTSFPTALPRRGNWWSLYWTTPG